MATSAPSLADSTFVQPLLAWFRQQGRQLPWRQSYDPYHVWISEIMLQQTQMERGVAYFLRWVRRFADVQAVAAASEQEILKYWEGLGYYARARNLHRAAREMVAHFSGRVPCDYQTLRSLPGIGPYTAAAIASVAGQQDVAVVDANVLRLFARLFDIARPVSERQCREDVGALATSFLPAGQARAYNQALMDLGGLICTPKRPRCGDCPIAAWCLARQRDTVSVRPLPGKRRAPVYLTWVAALIVADGRLFLQQRPAAAVWGGLWEFPGGELAEGDSPSTALPGKVLAACGLPVEIRRTIPPVSHQYTHHRVTLHGFICRIRAGGARQPNCPEAAAWQWVALADLHSFPFPAGPRKLLAAVHQGLAAESC